LWLLMVATGLAPMTSGAFFFNSLVLTGMFEAWFIYSCVKANWRLFRAVHENGRPLVIDEFGEYH
jgi:hypothetical protein